MATDSGTGHSLCSSFIHAHVHAGTGEYPYQVSYFGYGSTPEVSIEENSDSSASSIKGSSQNSGSDIENDTIPSSRSESPSELPPLPPAPPLPDIAGLSISDESTTISLDDNVSSHPHLQIAWSLGDIEPTGEHDEQGFPIWQVRGDNQRRFTEGNGVEPVGMSYPPHVYHEPGMLHRSMWTCLYGARSHNGGLSHRDYQSFERGYRERYGTDGC